jgi:hypothetical protein
MCSCPALPEPLDFAGGSFFRAGVDLAAGLEAVFLLVVAGVDF